MTHPIVACAADITASLKDVDGVEPVFMAVDDKEEALIALGRARAQLEALTLRVLAEAQDVAAAHGARDAGVWLASTSVRSKAATGRDLKLARALTRHPAVAAALATGDIHAEQAREIVAAVDALPSVVSSQIRDEAQRVLLELAESHDARDLRQLGKRILDIVATEVGESQEAKKLADEEAKADATLDFTLVDDGHGRCRGRFTLPSHVGKMLKRHLLALANPQRHDEADLKTDEGEWKPMPRRLAEAMVEYVERYAADRTPHSGGVNATIVITMTLEQILGDNTAALLDDGGRMSPGLARRLACEAGIVPVVLGGASQPLDVGRQKRLFTKSQRIALNLRDGGCTALGCDVPAAGCHAHHDDPWSRGGRTDLARGRLVCPRHHRLIHDPRYDVVIHPDNSLSFTRRT